MGECDECDEIFGLKTIKFFHKYQSFLVVLSVVDLSSFQICLLLSEEGVIPKHVIKVLILQIKVDSNIRITL